MGWGEWAGATRSDENARSRPPPDLPAPCLAAVSRPHSRTPWSAGARSSAAVTGLVSKHAGNGGRTGPNFRRGRSPPSAVGGARVGCIQTPRPVSQVSTRPGDQISEPRPVPPRPFQSEDSRGFCIYLYPKLETDSRPGLRGLERPARWKNTARLLGVGGVGVGI
jgi:hypothetical protein